MWTLLLHIGFAVFGIFAGLAVGLFTLTRMRKSKRGGAFALAGALFMAMGHFTPKPHAMEQASDHTKIKKSTNPGDPPEPDST